MISQSTFVIPPEIEAGLLSGDLIRYGGVVRNQLGHIVKHLKEVQAAPAKDETAAKAAALFRRPRVVISVAIVGVVALGTATVASMRRRTRAAFTPDCIKRYNVSLAQYLAAVREGRLDISIIEQLLEDLDAAVAYCEDTTNNFTLDFTSEQVVMLLKVVVDSTRQLANDNSIDLDGLTTTEPDDERSNVIDLRRRLEVQRAIFKTGN